MHHCRAFQRTACVVLAAAAISFGLSAAADPSASDQVVALQKSVSTLGLYAKPYEKVQARMPAKDVPFPLPVLEVDGDFLKVKLAGKEVWLDGAEVSVDKAVDYACLKETRKPTKTASIQGASTGCK